MMHYKKFSFCLLLVFTLFQTFSTTMLLADGDERATPSNSARQTNLYAGKRATDDVEDSLDQEDDGKDIKNPRFLSGKKIALIGAGMLVALMLRFAMWKKKSHNNDDFSLGIHDAQLPADQHRKLSNPQDSKPPKDPLQDQQLRKQQVAAKVVRKSTDQGLQKFDRATLACLLSSTRDQADLDRILEYLGCRKKTDVPVFSQENITNKLNEHFINELDRFLDALAEPLKRHIESQKEAEERLKNKSLKESEYNERFNEAQAIVSKLDLSSCRRLTKEDIAALFSDKNYSDHVIALFEKGKGDSSSFFAATLAEKLNKEEIQELGNLFDELPDLLAKKEKEHLTQEERERQERHDYAQKIIDEHVSERLRNMRSDALEKLLLASGDKELFKGLINKINGHSMSPYALLTVNADGIAHKLKKEDIVEFGRLMSSIADEDKKRQQRYDGAQQIINGEACKILKDMKVSALEKLLLSPEDKEAFRKFIEPTKGLIDKSDFLNLQANTMADKLTQEDIVELSRLMNTMKERQERFGLAGKLIRTIVRHSFQVEKRAWLKGLLSSDAERQELEALVKKVKGFTENYLLLSSNTVEITADLIVDKLEKEEIIKFSNLITTMALCEDARGFVNRPAYDTLKNMKKDDLEKLLQSDQDKADFKDFIAKLKRSDVEQPLSNPNHHSIARLLTEDEIEKFDKLIRKMSDYRKKALL
jgi:hypothetical protein